MNGYGNRRGARWAGRLWSALALGLITACVGRAEVEIDIRLEYRSVLQFEPTFLYLTVRNRGTDELLIDGSRGPEIEIHVQVDDERAADRLLPGRLVDYLRVAPDDEGLTVVDLGRWFDIRERRRYRIHAAMTWQGVHAVSRTVLLDVVPGIPLKTVRRQVPGYEGLVRNYRLLYWGRDQREHLFLRVDEAPSGLNYGVFLLGELIRVQEPELRVDGNGMVTVMHQSAARVFTRSRFTSTGDGVEFIGQTHYLEDGTPLGVPAE